MADPVLSWVGGKREEMKVLRSCLPDSDEYDAYHELFVGGGALFFDIEDHEAGSTINDINERLANLYSIIKDEDGYLELIDALKDVTKPATDPPEEDYEFVNPPSIENYYYQVRDQFNKRVWSDEPLSREERVYEAARFIYLNKTCYNAVYRENSKGEFNVPYGDTEQPNISTISDRIKEAHRILQGIQILNKDYSDIVNPDGLGEFIESGDLVYFDPPYRGTYDQYHASSFDFEEQIELRDTAMFLDEKGVYVVISNSLAMADAYLIEEGSNFSIVPVGKRRMVNADGANRDEKIDIIVTNADIQPELAWDLDEIRSADIDDILSKQQELVSDEIETISSQVERENSTAAN